jgi:DNA polymerase III delta prime subunit
MKITNKHKIQQGAYNLYEDKGIWAFLHNEHFTYMSKNSFKNSIWELKKEKKVVKISQSQYTLIEGIPDNIELLKQIKLKNKEPIIAIKRTENVPIHLNTIYGIHTWGFKLPSGIKITISTI